MLLFQLCFMKSNLKQSFISLFWKLEILRVKITLSKMVNKLVKTNSGQPYFRNFEYFRSFCDFSIMLKTFLKIYIHLILF